MKLAGRIPIVQAALERTRYSWVWVVTTCPYCGQPHEHYGGSLDTNPDKYLAYRMTAHCPPSVQQGLTAATPASRLQYILQVPRTTEVPGGDAAYAGGQREAQISLAVETCHGTSFGT